MCAGIQLIISRCLPSAGPPPPSSSSSPAACFQRSAPPGSGWLMSGLSGTPLSSGPSVLAPYARLRLPLAAKDKKPQKPMWFKCDIGVQQFS